jgi:two-component system, NarL family, sensor kinase
VTMNVTDDGRGFDPAHLPERRREGHVGLRALDDLVAQRDGHLDVASTPGGGTTVRVDLPRRPWSFVEVDDQGVLTTGVSRAGG